jgi:hypothetical protein
MNKLVLILIIILALASMAPGTPPAKTPPPPIETEPVATESVETQPPAIDTEPVVVTEPPVVVTDVWEPQWLPTREGKDKPDAVLPAGGYGPQGTPEPVRCLSLLAVLALVAWRLVK